VSWWHRHMLASGSADHTVKLWDLGTQRAVRSFGHHRDKVQVVTWNPAEPSVVLTGAYDRTAAVFDVRAPTKIAAWTLTADVEAARWNPFSPQYYLVRVGPTGPRTAAPRLGAHITTGDLLASVRASD
jgi:periodic tryptophan protein 1